MNGRISILLKKRSAALRGSFMIKEMEQRSPEEIKFPAMASTGEMGNFFYYSLNFKPILGWVLPLGRMNG
jgi:hypothetical protein